MATPNLQLTDPNQSASIAASENSIPPEFQQAVDPFWADLTIAEERWDQAYPFQLILLKEPGHQQVSKFTLPIPPTAINQSDPFASEMSVSIGGVIEEHNGIPVEPIVLSGTTGVLPGRPEGSVQPTSSIGQAFFAGTLQGVGETVGAANQVVNSSAALLGTGTAAAVNLVSAADVAGPLKGTTGYYQFLLLESWLRGYANLKKSAAGRDYRLAFAHWKKQEVLLVTPIDFTAVKTSEDPLEWTYTLSMKAWRRVDLSQSPNPGNLATDALHDPDALRQLAGTIDASRSVLAGLRDTLLGVRADADADLFEPLRSAALFARDALGVALTLADLPVTVVQDAKRAVLAAASVLPVSQATGATLLSVPGVVDSEFQGLRGAVVQAATRGSQPLGLTGATSAAQSPSADPVERVFQDVTGNYDFFSRVQVGSLSLDPATTRRVAAERARVQALRRADFAAIRDRVVKFGDDYADGVGLGDPTYSAVRGRTFTPTSRTPTDDDFDALYAVNQAVTALNKLAAAPDPRTGSTYLDYFAGLAQASGITFTSPRSKRYVAFPYGASLEGLAQRYLGDPDRWHEVAALNGLREPYVDEVGFDLPFAAPGDGNTVPLSDASALRVGQSVWVGDRSTPQQVRHVVAIDQFAPGMALVTLDGDPNMGDFTVAGGAFLHAYAPDTVNSLMLVAIPSDQSPDEDTDLVGTVVPDLDVFDAWYRAGGVDLGVTQSGSFAITPDGDWSLAVGLSNLIQRANNYVNTPRGSVPRRATYGADLKPGQSLADLTAQDVLNQLGQLVLFDPEFRAVTGTTVTRTGGGTQVITDLQVEGSDQRLPVAFQLPQ